MSLCKRIKSLCATRGLSLYRIEKECGFGNGSIMKWETSSPKVENIVKLADYFGVSVDYLLGRDEISLQKSLQTNNTQDKISTISDINSILANNDGIDYIEKIYKQFEWRQKVYVLTWLIGYAQSQGIQIKL